MKDKMKKFGAWLIAAALAFAGTGAARAETVKVADQTALEAELVKVNVGESAEFELAAGEFTTYGMSIAQGKTLTFIGALGANGELLTTWKYGKNGTVSSGEGASDYSFEGANVTFRNLVVADNLSVNNYYRGLVRSNGLVFENCTIRNMMGYLGSGDVVFKDCTFDVADVCEYCIKTYSGCSFVFDGCTFKSNNKGFVQVYCEKVDAVRKVMVKNCTFIAGANTSKSAIYFYDYSYGQGATWDIDFVGKNVVTEGHKLWGDMKIGTGAKTRIAINGVAVWENGANVVTVEDVKPVVASAAEFDVVPADGETEIGSGDVEVVEAVMANAAVEGVETGIEDATAGVAADKKYVSVVLTSASVSKADSLAKVVSMTFEVTPCAVKITEGSKSVEAIPNSAITAPITFRFPVDAAVAVGTKADVTHNGVAMAGDFAVAGDDTAKYIEVASATFSTFAYTLKETAAATVAKVIDLEGVEKEYETLAAAVAAVEDGETVKLLGDVTVDAMVSCAKAITIDGAGFTLSASEENWTGKYLLSVSGDGAMVKNLTLDGEGRSFDRGLLGISGGDKLIQGVTMANANNAVRYAYVPNGKTVTFNDCVFMAKTYGIHFDGNAGGKVIVKDSTVTGFSTLGNIDIEFTGCTFTKGVSSYSVCQAWGTMVISNSEFTASWTDVSADNCYVGTATAGAVVELSNNTGMGAFIGSESGSIVVADAKKDGDGLYTAGTFYGEPAADVIAPGYEAIPQGTTPETWVVQLASRTINVANTAEAQAALDAAKKGDTIVFAAGDYGTIYIRNNGEEANRILENVTLISAEGAEVTVDEFYHQQVSGKSLDIENLVIDGFTFDDPTVPAMSFDVNGSGGLRVNGLTVKNCIKVGNNAKSAAPGQSSYNEPCFAVFHYDSATPPTVYTGDTSLQCGYHDIQILSNNIAQVYMPIAFFNSGILNGLTVVGNTFTDCTDNHIQKSGDQTSGDFVIKDNVIVNMTGRFARISGATADATFTIENNTVTTPRQYDTGGDPDIFKITGAVGFTVSEKDNQWLDGSYSSGGATWIAAGDPTLLPVKVCQIGETKYPSIAAALEAIGATESKTGTIKMIDNETMPGNNGVKIPGGYDVTLDLNGFRVCNDANVSDYSTTIEIAANAKLTVKDTSDGANGVIINAVAEGTNGDWGSTPQKNWASDTVVNHGTLILESGNIVNTTGGISYCVDNESNVSACMFVMNGGKLYNNYGDQAVRVYAISGASIDQKLENRFEMHGGEIVTGGFWVQMAGAIGGNFDAAKNWATVLIDGGTINGFIDVGNTGTCDVEIGGNAVINASKMRFRSLGGTDKFVKFTGGKISIPVFDDQTGADYYPAVVSGGVFTDAAKTGLANYVAVGYAFVENTDPETSADYPWTIGEVAAAVAKIVETGKEYETLEAAYAEVEAGQTIKLLVDEIESLGHFPTDVTIEGVEGKTSVAGTIDSRGLPFYYKMDDVTFRNLKFTTTASAIRYVYIDEADSTFLIDNCEFAQGGSYAVHFDGNNKGNVVILNSKLKGWSSFAEKLNSLTISNCLFEAGSYAKIRPYINCEIKDCRFTEAFVEKSKEQAQSGYGPAIDMVVKATDAIAVEVDGCSVVDSDGKPSAKYGLNDLFNSYSVTGSDDKPIAGGLIAVDAEKDENGKYVSGMLAGLKDYLLTQIGTKCTLSDVSDGVFSVVSSQKPEVEVKDESGEPEVKDPEGQPIPAEKKEDAKKVADDVKTEVTQTLTEPEVAKFEGTGVAESATEIKKAGDEHQIIEVKPEVVEALQKEVAKQEEKNQITKDSKVESRVEIVFNALEVKVDAAAEVVKATETSVQYDVKPKVKTTVITTVGEQTEEKVVETVIPNEVIKGNPIKFRLAVDSTFGDFARVKHTGTGDNDGNFIEEYLAEVFTANDANGKKFVELSSDHFSTFKLTSTSETPVCRVGDKNYTSLAEAIKKGGATAEIVLLANIELVEDVTLGYNQTIDPGEFAISGEGKVKADTGYEVRIVNGKSVVYAKPTEVTVAGDQKIAVCIEPSVLEQLGGADKLADTAANGFQVWQNYVMGVDGEIAGNKLVPICKPNAENPGAAAVTITTPMTFGVAPAKTGIAVTYQLLKSATPKSGFTMVGEEQTAPVFTVDTSAEENATYWKIQAIFTPDAN